MHNKELSADKVYDELMTFFQKKLLQLKNVDEYTFIKDDLYEVGKYDMIEEVTDFIRELYNKEEC